MARNGEPNTTEHLPYGLSERAAGRIAAELFEVDDDALIDDGPEIPGYLLTRELGAGAASTVYQAYRHGSEAPLAIKVMRAPVGAARRGHRAWRELELLQQLRLPCLPRVHDFGIYRGLFYIVTDLVEGRSLDAFCRENELDLRDRMAVLARVAECVQLLHEYGVIHRDLKPRNVVIDDQGRPIILDLGIAMVEGTEPGELTRDGQPIGSPAFMSPEQARGNADQTSIRSDIFSLGAIGYLLASGQTPYSVGDSLPDMVRRIAQEPPRSLRTLERGIPAPLAAILEKAVAFQPEDRFDSATEMALYLTRWVQNEPIDLVPISLSTRLWHAARRHPGRFAAALVLCTAFGAAVFSASVAMANVKLADERQQIIADRESLLVEQQMMIADRDALVEQQQQLLAEREALLKEQQAMIVEREELAALYRERFEGLRQHGRTLVDIFTRYQAAIRADVDEGRTVEALANIRVLDQWLYPMNIVGSKVAREVSEERTEVVINALRALYRIDTLGDEDLLHDIQLAIEALEARRLHRMQDISLPHPDD